MQMEILQYPETLANLDRIPRRAFTYPKAWTRNTLKENDYLFKIPGPCVQELNVIVDSLRHDPLPVLMLKPDMFMMDACRTFMASVKKTLVEGTGCAVLHKLPIEDIAREEAIALYWLLGSLIAPPVAQKWNGLMIYDVRDVGAKHGIGVRGSTTNAELNFHTDNSYALMPPFFIGLLCCQTAREGGKSRLLSWRSVFNVLLDRYPDLLPRAFDTFFYDRNNEHVPDAPKVMCKAPFALKNGDIEVRFSPNGIPDGHELIGRPIDDEGKKLLEKIREITADPELWVEFDFEPGQIQFINNHVIGHARTGFKDWPEPERKRHLVRLWFRDEGRISYDG
jgi:hypothetical protein